MDVIVTGRRCTISDDFREKVAERITGIERFRDRVQRVEVQVSTNQHKQPDQAIQVEITLIGKGPVVRSGSTIVATSAAFSATSAATRLSSSFFIPATATPRWWQARFATLNTRSIPPSKISATRC